MDPGELTPERNPLSPKDNGVAREGNVPIGVHRTKAGPVTTGGKLAEIQLGD